MKCEKCGKEMGGIGISINCFNHDGTDSLYIHSFDELTNVIVVDTDKSWTGYELTEEEQLETIKCPHCDQFPFKVKEIQVHEIVRIVMFKKEHEDDDI